MAPLTAGASSASVPAASTISVILPTYGRPESVRRALAALATQRNHAATLDLIVVDDGTPEPVAPFLDDDSWPFRLRCVRQPRSGVTAARNHGARLATGAVLVFLDDDIRPAPDALGELVAALPDSGSGIVVGSLRTRVPAPMSPFARMVLRREGAALTVQARTATGGVLALAPEHCLTGFLAVRRTDFEALGGFRDPTGGWPNWDDVDFGCRAAAAGFTVSLATRAVAEHWDHAVSDLDSACDRWRRAAASGAVLLARQPALAPRLPMFRDMTPLALLLDPIRLSLRKLARRAASSAAAQWLLLELTRPLERKLPDGRLLERCYGLIVGACVYRGFQAGLAGNPGSVGASPAPATLERR